VRRYAVALVLLAATMLGSVLIGSAGLSPGSVLAALLDELPAVHIASGLGPVEHAVLFQIRLPRVVMAAMVGAMLAISGAGYQGVFRNPLVDSGMLGASAGAGLGATLAIVYLGNSQQAVPAAAFAGAIAGVALAYLVGSAGGSTTPTLLLGGVAVGMFLVAVQTYVLQRSTQDLQAVYSWLLGSLSGATWSQCAIALPYAAVSSILLAIHARHLDVLSVGDEEAAALGLRPGRVRLLVIAACALATATAVAVSGLIGFVGIIVPHVVRRLGGVAYSSVLPLSLIVGAAFLTAADTVARTVISPGELPIGVVTALVGCPMFVWILRITTDAAP
jgi:iron complex transport system permease protein